jgi:hypothetical protein
MDMSNWNLYTTAELQLAIVKHHEGRITYPAKMRKEIETEIQSRGAAVPRGR